MSGSATGAPLARYAAWKRRGDFIFLSGVIAVDAETGRVVSGYEDLPLEVRRKLGETGELSIDVFEGPIAAQSWFALDRIRTLVEEAGGSMADVFKLVQYFRDLRDYPGYGRVRKMFFPEEPPVSTVVEVSGMLPGRGVLVEVEATAYLPLRGNLSSGS